MISINRCCRGFGLEWSPVLPADVVLFCEMDQCKWTSLLLCYTSPRPYDCAGWSCPCFSVLINRLNEKWRGWLSVDVLFCSVPPLTHLQFTDDLHQRPVETVATVRFVQQAVQHLTHRLPLIHHHGFGAFIRKVYSDHQLRGTGDQLLVFRLTDWLTDGLCHITPESLTRAL